MKLNKKFTAKLQKSKVKGAGISVDRRVPATKKFPRTAWPCGRPPKAGATSETSANA